jgi:hypothetical protein
VAVEGWGPVEGWCSVEQLVRWAFAHAPVVMANEAHSGLARCVRTREVGVRILRDQAPPPLDGWAGVDALVVSTDNEMTA